MVTGAAGSLGKTTSISFFMSGAKMAVVDRQRDMVVEVFGSMIPEGDDCYFDSANLIDENSVTTMTKGIFNHFGRVDVLVNIAGGFSMGPPLHETPIETWDAMMNINARTVFLVSRAVIPQMQEKGKGKIINIAARAALTGKANMAPYVASKSAVIRLTESMAAELKDNDINVNCILPGTIDTKENRDAMPDADYSNWVKPEAIADVIQFLASDGARAINGAAIPVYGRS